MRETRRKMETDKNGIGDVGIGEDVPQLAPKRCMVVGSEVRLVGEGTKKQSEKIVLKLRHPDRDEIEISAVKYLKGDSLKESGIWLHKDTSGKIPFRSALAALLRHYNCRKLNELVGREVDTLLDGNGYLIIKAY